jgi:hypothetical protein
VSKPFLNVEDALQGALNEIVSAESALNMEPDPVIPKDPPEGRGPFLSESDAWVQHAMEHMHAAFQLVLRAQRERESLRHQIWRLEAALGRQAVTVSGDVAARGGGEPK